MARGGREIRLGLREPGRRQLLDAKLEFAPLGEDLLFEDRRQHHRSRPVILELAEHSDVTVERRGRRDQRASQREAHVLGGQIHAWCSVVRGVTPGARRRSRDGCRRD